MKEQDSLDELFRKKLTNRNFEPEEEDWEKAWALIQQTPIQSPIHQHFNYIRYGSIIAIIGLMTGLIWFGWQFFPASFSIHLTPTTASNLDVISANAEKQKSKQAPTLLPNTKKETEQNTVSKEGIQKKLWSSEIENANTAQMNQNSKLTTENHSPTQKTLNLAHISNNLSIKKPKNQSDKFNKEYTLVDNNRSFHSSSASAASFNWLAVQIEADLFGAIIQNPWIEKKTSILETEVGVKMPLQIDSLVTQKIAFKEDSSHIESPLENPTFKKKPRNIHLSVSGGLLTETSGQLHSLGNSKNGNVEVAYTMRNQAKTGVYIEPEIRWKGLLLGVGMQLWTMPQSYQKLSTTHDEAYTLKEHQTVIDTGYYTVIMGTPTWIPIKQTLRYTSVDTIPLISQQKEQSVERVTYIEFPLSLGYAMRKNRIEIGIRAGISWAKPIRIQGETDLFHTQLPQSYWSVQGRFRMGYAITEYVSVYAEPNLRYVFKQSQTQSDMFGGLKIGLSLSF